MPKDNAPTAEKDGYNGYIPPASFTALSWEAAGLIHGTATLTLHVRDGKLYRYTTGRERSFVTGGSGEE